ncbi:MAG TPA: lipid-A-disaccharide synthase [Planctomycetota bacterium]|nr:lipid-A-disaccharide synthase [Planctomycetota bacterium]
MEPVKVFLVAGESSGDSHAAELVRALRELDPTVRCESLGGPLLEAAGAPTPFDFVAHATMGFVPVLKKLPFFRRALAETVERLAKDPPHVLVPVDYPGFNLRLAKKAKDLGIPVCYYVSPQVWAWAGWRVKKIARSVDHMMCLFPFEKTFYESHGVPVTHVGHPIFDAMRAEKRAAGFREQLGVAPTEPIVALLPGSREFEIDENLPLMLEVAKAIAARAPDARFVVPCAHEKLRPRIDALVQASGVVAQVLDGQAREVGRRARVALVTSGTATLELLFHEVPMVIVYAASQLKVNLVRKFLVKLQWIGLVNILGGKDVVPEFIGNGHPRDEVAKAAIELLRDGRARKKTLARLQDLKREVAGPGASRRAAEVVLALARSGAARAASK